MILKHQQTHEVKLVSIPLCCYADIPLLSGELLPDCVSELLYHLHTHCS